MVSSQNSAWKLGASLSELHCICQRRHLKKTSVFRKAISLSFVCGFFVESFWLWAKKYRHVCQNCILSLTGKNWGRTFEQFRQCLFFSDFRRQLVEFVANYLGQLCRNCLVSVQRNHLGKNWRKIFLFVFG